jgi:hypothetical protein
VQIPIWPGIAPDVQPNTKPEDIKVERVRIIIQSAINEALLIHKKLGNPVCTLKDGKVHWVRPEDIVINEVK